MTKKEKAILKLAQKWAHEEYKPRPGAKAFKDIELSQWIQRTQCGRALLKILEP